MNPEERREFLRRVGIAAIATIPAAAIAEAQAPVAPSETASVAGKVVNIVDFGAHGDGKTVCTAFIQKAVDACAQSGGGKVIVPPGRFLSGPIFLKSNLEFELMAGATLALTTDFAAVSSIQGRWEGIDRVVYASLLNGADLENVSITGAGTLDGQGDAWWQAFRADHELRRKLGLEDREPENPPGSKLRWGRPRIINLYRCQNVLIRGLHVMNSPSWNIHPVACEHLLIDGVTITAPMDSPNTDGIDPDSCKDVRIANCYISVGDDCIIIKSGYKFNPHGIPCENIAVTNCVFGHGHCGVGVGSETASGVKNVVVSNCLCDGTLRGLRIKTARGRGRSVENIRASNILMRNVEEPIAVTMFYNGGDIHEAAPVDEHTPRFRNFHFSQIFATNAKLAARIEGLREMPIEELSLSEVHLEDCAAGIACTNVNGLALRDVFVRNVKGPALTVDTVRNAEASHFTSASPKNSAPAMRFVRVENAVVECCRTSSDMLLELAGQENRAVSLIANRVPTASELRLVDGATNSAIAKRI